MKDAYTIHFRCITCIISLSKVGGCTVLFELGSKRENQFNLFTFFGSVTLKYTTTWSRGLSTCIWCPCTTSPDSSTSVNKLPGTWPARWEFFHSQRWSISNFPCSLAGNITVWRTWLSIAYSDEIWSYTTNSHYLTYTISVFFNVSSTVVPWE